MRKKVSIVCVMVVVMVLFIFVYKNDKFDFYIETAQAEMDENNKLEFEQKGIYKTVAFGEEYFVYKFDVPNENIVVYQTIDGIYLIGKNAKKSGISYGNIFMPEGEFLALSSEYLLFEKQDEKIAVRIEKKKGVKTGESFYEQYSFEELSDKQKEAFVYPIECKKEER